MNDLILEELENNDEFLKFFDSFEKNNKDLDEFNNEEINSLLKEKQLTKKRKRENDFLKKKEKLKKNAESARNARLRKKLLMESLIEENKKLRNLICFYQNEIQFLLCEECKKKIKKPKSLFITSNVQNKNNILKNKKLFSIVLSLISILLFFSFNYFNFINQKIKFRNLTLLQHKYSYLEYSNKDLKNFNLIYNKIFISYGDYYSLITRKNFLNENNLTFSFKNEGIQYFKEDDFELHKKINNCKHCIIELYRNKIEYDPNRMNRFKLYFYPKKILTPEGIINFENNRDENGYEYKTFFEVDCLSIGFSKNRLYDNDTNNHFY